VQGHAPFESAAPKADQGDPEACLIGVCGRGQP
jgi:hypothetical protein